MSIMKKLLAVALTASISAGAAIAGTMAYLQDTESDVNVMTLGNVDIEQHEYQRAEGVSHINTGAQKDDLVPFVQGQPLYPTVPKADDAYEAEQAADRGFHWGEYVTADGAWNGLWDDDKLANVLDKFVFVENTGKSDAYYRTLIALECPESMKIGYASQEAEIETNINGNSRFGWDYGVGYITVDGTRYEVWNVTYSDVLKPGEISRPSLLQVILTEYATNEDMVALGGSYDILVLSQAVQTAGFADAKTALNTAFGEVTADKAAEWFGGAEFDVPDTVVDSVADVADAIEAGDADILYTGTDPLTFNETLEVTGKVTISSTGAPVEFDTTAFEAFSVKDGASLEFANVTVDAGKADRAIAVEEGGKVVFGEGTEIVADDDLEGSLVAAYADGAEVVLKGVKISGLDNGGAESLFDVSNGATLVIEDGTVISGNTVYGGSMPYGLFEVTDGGELIMNGGEISGNNFAKALFNVSRGGKFTMNGGIITDNTLTGSNGTLFFMVMSGSSFEMTGGEIVDNNLNGNAVFNNSSMATLNGNVVS